MVEPAHTKLYSNRPRFIKRVWNDPFTDWAIILIVAFVLMMVTIGFSIRLFIDVSSQSFSGVATSTSSKSTVANQLNISGLNSLSSIFQSKAAQAPVFIFSYPGPADPAAFLQPTKKVSK